MRPRRVGKGEWYRLWVEAGRPNDLRALDVDCPACGAPVGEPCRSRRGRRHDGHACRYDAALLARIPERQASLFELPSPASPVESEAA